MSVSTKLSKLKKVPLRDVWQNEAADFTKWLAREENLSMLGDAIGIDLEPIETESSVGSFSADIYAKTADDRKVIVENQLEDSDHDHLGKIITYASGKDARVIVWIVARARPEHAQAVEWLNAHTDEDIGLFLIEMELWKIGGSDPAPKFSVVERPNDWGKAMKGYEVLSPTKQVQLDYWQAFHDQTSSDEAFMRVLRPQMPHPQNWSDLAIGSSLCHINLTADTQKGRISCGIYIDEDRELYEKVKARQNDFAEAIGAKPELWTGSKASGLRFFKEGCNVKGHPELWGEYIGWQMKSAMALKRIFDEIR